MNKDDFLKCIQLYKSGISIKRVNPIDNQTYKVLITSNVDIRIIDRDKYIAEISTSEALKKLTRDSEMYSNRFVYIIPLQTIKGTIVGFILRSVFGKNYATINKTFTDKNKKLPIMFGFYEDFRTFDNYNTCKPIIICEGLKDCITLKKIYPYVLSNNTSSMGINLQVLSNLTDKFILIYDNDDAGNKGMDLDVKRAQELHYFVVKISPKSCYKDCADCYENEEDFNEFTKIVQTTIKQLEDQDKNYKLIGRKIIDRNSLWEITNY